jgi:hypothetical protein
MYHGEYRSEVKDGKLPGIDFLARYENEMFRSRTYYYSSGVLVLLHESMSWFRKTEKPFGFWSRYAARVSHPNFKAYTDSGEYEHARRPLKTRKDQPTDANSELTMAKRAILVAKGSIVGIA